MITVYVINLARSPERKAWMEAELARAGVEGRFVRAVDGRRFGLRCDIAAREALQRRPQSRAEAALTLSHRKAWREFLASGDDHAVILEDDVHVGGDFRQMLLLDWKIVAFDAVKLETMFHEVWLSRHGLTAGKRRLHRLGAEHLGSAAYLISRTGARKMLAATRSLTEAVDYHLFGPHALGENGLIAFQLVPAIAVQDNMLSDPKFRVGLGTTLHEEDRKRLVAQARRAKPKGLNRVLRETRRLGNQFRRWLRLAPTMRRQRVNWE